MSLTTFLLVAITATQAAGATQAPPADAAQTPDAMTAPPLVTTNDACPPDVEADYKEGFEAMSRGDDEDALEAFERVEAACPQHPHAAESARLLRARVRPGRRLAEASLAESPFGPERKSGGARAGLIVVQTIHGATQGILLCAIAECKDQGYSTASLLGAGLGVAVSIVGTLDGITPGKSAAINAGTVWGFWFGLASIVALDTEGDDALATVMLSGAGFTGLGLLVALAGEPTAGQVAMANSGGLWTGIVTALFLATLDEGDERSFFGAEMAATGGGLLAFSLLSRVVPVTRGRMLLIDAGGIIGGLAGAALVFSFTGNDLDDGDIIYLGAGMGTLGGLALTTYLTRNFDYRNMPEVTLAPTSTKHGGMGLAMMGRF
ncbi:MAG TPA: hypothetical protein VE153_28735 [Myxococcus sp.]|nr:hypothetical protein [Myxococcus sp.]